MLRVYPSEFALLKDLCQIYLLSNVLDLTDLKEYFLCHMDLVLNTGIECICSKLPCVIKSKEFWGVFFPLFYKTFVLLST